MPREVGAAAAVVFAVIATACGGESDNSTRRALALNVDLIRAPKGVTFSSPSWWTRERRLVVVVTKPGRPSTSRLYTLGRDGSGGQYLQLPRDSYCDRYSDVHPIVLHDARLAFIRQCWGGDIDPARSARLLAYNARSKTVAPLVAYPLRFQMGPFAYSPDGSRAVLNTQEGLYERLVWVTRRGLRPIPQLAFERVGFPTWSPNGGLIAFDAAPTAGQAEGVDRLDLDRNLYLFDVEARELRMISRSIGDAGRSAWSPDGRWLAAVAAPADGTEGLYIFDTRSGDRRLILRGEGLEAPAWMPSGEMVVTVGRFAHLAPNGERTPVGLYKFRLPNLVQLFAAAR